MAEPSGPPPDGRATDPDPARTVPGPADVGPGPRVPDTAGASDPRPLAALSGAAADRERWDGRHAVAGPTVAAPPDALRGRESLLPVSGRMLDVACGRGGVAVWFARRGWRVDAVDVSPVGLAAGAAAAPQVTWHVHDLGRGLPVECAGPYDVVVCQRFRDPALYPALAAALAPGGLLVLTVLSEVGDTAGPYRAAPGELAAAFPELEHLAHAERDGQATLLARRGP